MIETRAKEILAELLDVPASSIDSSTSAESVLAWDSLKHIMIVSTLEEEFGIELSIEEIQTSTSYERIVRLLQEKAP